MPFLISPILGKQEDLYNMYYSNIKQCIKQGHPENYANLKCHLKRYERNTTKQGIESYRTLKYTNKSIELIRQQN